MAEAPQDIHLRGAAGANAGLLGQETQIFHTVFSAIASLSMIVNISMPSKIPNRKYIKIFKKVGLDSARNQRMNIHLKAAQAELHG